MGTEARGGRAGVKNGSKGSSGLGGYEGGVGNEKDEKEEGQEAEGEKETEREEEQEDEERRSVEEETEEATTEEEETEEEEHEEGREKDNKEEESGPCIVVELSTTPCARIPGGRTEEVEKGVGGVKTASLILLLLSETGGKFWDTPGGGRKEADDGDCSVVEERLSAERLQRGCREGAVVQEGWREVYRGVERVHRGCREGAGRALRSEHEGELKGASAGACASVSVSACAVVIEVCECETGVEFAGCATAVVHGEEVERRMPFDVRGVKAGVGFVKDVAVTVEREKQEE